MKLIAALTLLIAGVLGAPAPCSHVMGFDVAKETSAAINESHPHHDLHAHGGMGHHAPDSSHGDATGDHDDHGCADECEGGVGCDGCTITNAAMSLGNAFHHHILFDGPLEVTFAIGADKPTTLDPPPPRA